MVRTEISKVRISRVQRSVHITLSGVIFQVEGTGNDSSPISREAHGDPDHLPPAEAEVTLSKGPSETQCRVPCYPQALCFQLPTRQSPILGVPGPLALCIDGTGRSHTCGPLYIWKTVTLLALIL